MHLLCNHKFKKQSCAPAACACTPVCKVECIHMQLTLVSAWACIVELLPAWYCAILRKTTDKRTVYKLCVIYFIRQHNNIIEKLLPRLSDMSNYTVDGAEKYSSWLL